MFTITKNKFGIDGDVKQYVLQAFRDKFKTNMTTVLDQCIEEIADAPNFIENFMKKTTDVVVAAKLCQMIQGGVGVIGQAAELALP